MIMDSPCYNCDRRVATSEYNCHSDCEDYANYKKELSTVSNCKKEDVYSAYIEKAIYRRRMAKHERRDS